MDGNEATRKIRNELTGYKKDVPIVSFSASVLEKERNEAKNAGADDFIGKPFEPKILNSKIHELLDNEQRFTSAGLGWVINRPGKKLTASSDNSRALTWGFFEHFSSFFELLAQILKKAKVKK